MLKKIALLTLMLAALGIPAFAAQSIQGAAAVASVDASTYLGTTNGVGCRYYSVAGSETGINLNTVGCGGIRCLRNYNAAQSKYICNGENTAPYNADADGQTFYNLIDGQANPAACNHAAFYGLQGMITNSLTINSPGDFRTAGCPGTTAVNCMELDDAAKARSTPLSNVNAGLQGPNQILSLGGLSPVPTPRVQLNAANGCPAGQAKVTWDEAENYAGAMKNGVATSLQGVRLWKSSSPCNVCPTGDVAAGGWTPVAFFATGAGAAGTCQPVSGDTWYALTVVVKGGGAAPSQLDSGIVGTPGSGGIGFVGANSQCVNTSPTAIRITGVTARYAGRGSVNVSFQTGSEAGISNFQVQRSSSPAGPWTAIGEPMAPRGDGSTYTVTDKVRASLGHVLYYAVQVSMNDGTSFTTGSSAVTLPAVQKKITPGNN